MRKCVLIMSCRIHCVQTEKSRWFSLRLLWQSHYQACCCIQPGQDVLTVVGSGVWFTIPFVCCCTKISILLKLFVCFDLCLVVQVGSIDWTEFFCLFLFSSSSLSIDWIPILWYCVWWFRLDPQIEQFLCFFAFVFVFIFHSFQRLKTYTVIVSVW